MSKKVYYYTVSILFFVIAALHLLRALYQLQVTVDEVVIPIWISFVATAIALYLSIRGWQFARKK